MFLLGMVRVENSWMHGFHEKGGGKGMILCSVFKNLVLEAPPLIDPAVKCYSLATSACRPVAWVVGVMFGSHNSEEHDIKWVVC